MSRFVTNGSGYRELFTSGEMYQFCWEAAQKIAADANADAASAAHSPCEPYVPHADVHANTCVGHVVCKTRFIPLENKYGCLKKAIK